MSIRPTDSILEVTSLYVRFGGIRALNDVTFSVIENGITAVIGPNGAGKTTLFNCLTGFYKPSQGDIRYSHQGRSWNIPKLLGEEYQGSDLFQPQKLFSKFYYRVFGGSHQVASLGIARTFQNIRLFKEMTVIENLIVAQHRQINRNLLSGLMRTKSYRQSESQAAEKAFHWLKFVGLESQGNRLAGELPYGHQRRLEIARAMCTDPRLVCLDEPAAGLNHRETEELSELIRKLGDLKYTVLVIEHDMSLVMGVSDQIIVLNHGEVIAQGTPKQVKHDPHVLAAYLGDEGEV